MSKNTKIVEMDVESEVEETPTPAQQTKNDKIKADVLAKIKSKFLGVETVNGRAQMLDPNSTHPGIDYTAGGLLHRYWATNSEANLQAKRMKGFMLPSEVSSELPNITRGNQVLMVRSKAVDDKFRAQKEREARQFEARTMGNSEQASQAKGVLGEFEVTQPTKHRE